MQIYLENKLEVVRYVADQLADFDDDCALTMTIIRKKSGGFVATTVTGSSSEDTAWEQAEQLFCNTQVNT